MQAQEEQCGRRPRDCRCWCKGAVSIAGVRVVDWATSRTRRRPPDPARGPDRASSDRRHELAAAIREQQVAAGQGESRIEVQRGLRSLGGRLVSPGGGARRAATGRSLRHKSDRPGTPGWVIASDGKHSCDSAGRRDRFGQELSRRMPAGSGRVQSRHRDHPRSKWRLRDPAARFLSDHPAAVRPSPTHPVPSGNAPPPAVGRT